MSETEIAADESATATAAAAAASASSANANANVEPITNDYEFNSECVVIDPYRCDLNLIVDRECLLAYPLAGDGFSAMWAGCRASFGAYRVKTAFEVHASITCLREPSTSPPIYVCCSNTMPLTCVCASIA